MQLISKSNIKRVSYFLIGISIMLLIYSITYILNEGLFLEN